MTRHPPSTPAGLTPSWLLPLHGLNVFQFSCVAHTHPHTHTTKRTPTHTHTHTHAHTHTHTHTHTHIHIHTHTHTHTKVMKQAQVQTHYPFKHTSFFLPCCTFEANLTHT